MKILDQLDELNLDAAAKTQVAALVQALLDQVKKDAETLQAKDLKIQALILELAHLRRFRYGVKSEALSGLQRDLFEETCNEDVAALEAEVEQTDD
jgi:transposase